MTVKSKQTGWGADGASQKVVLDEKPSSTVHLLLIVD
jgi:hypothetical protein